MTVIVTEYGAVRGASTSRPGVTAFRGIPFGADTGGERRWREPEPPTPWDDVRDASKFGPACPQNQSETDWPTSEDCLSINVWTGDTDAAAKRPVLVWIHGGRFVWGSGCDPQFDGAALAERGIIVVTFNYRIGVFGFLATPELSNESERGASGNYGLLDQIEALHWVQRNIANFGGDPDRVTIAGQSAGAASVMTLVYSPLTEGLFAGAIAESGASHPRDPGLAYLAAAYRELPAAVAEGSLFQQEHGARSIAELRAVSADELLVGNDANEPGESHPRPPLFRPVLDGWVFPRRYSEALEVGAQRDIPILTGTTKDEDGASPHPNVTLASFRARAERDYGELAPAFLRLYEATDDAEAAACSNQAARDHSRTSTYLWSRLWADHAVSPTFTYFWTHVPPGPDAESHGAFHGGEIWYFLDSLDVSDRPWTDEDRRIADTMARYVVAFVSTGDPNAPGLPHWSPTESLAETMELGDRFEPIPVASAERFDFQRRYLESRPAAR
jgi:para-nitrobenzyl esterase